MHPTDKETPVLETSLRALIGEWEDGEVVFLGAISQDHHEALLSEDFLGIDGKWDRWEQMKTEWVERGPAGVGDTREVDVTLSVPADLFSTPQLSATATEEPTNEH